MLKFEGDKIDYDYLQCQQCGICEAICPKKAINFRLREDGTHDVEIDNDKCILCQRCVKSCPANVVEDYNCYFDGFDFKHFFFGYNLNEKIRHDCSSGGVCKTIIIEGLRSGWFDGVYALRRMDKYPFAEGEFFTKGNIPIYEDIPNSVYHSVMASQNVKKIKQCHRLLVVGTSCQLRAMNTVLRGKAEEVVRVCIFCKQQKTLDSTRFIAKMMRTEIPKDNDFFCCYRGQGWPGIVRIKDAKLSWSMAASLPFGRRLWTVAGCNICGDPFGINADADISLMDPWGISQSNPLGETLIIVHTERGLEVLRQIASLGLEEKTFDAVKEAFDLKDIWRKQQLVPFFRGEMCNRVVRKAGRIEQLQRKFFIGVLERLPYMTTIFYKILCKIPDLRNKILK